MRRLAFIAVAGLLSVVGARAEEAARPQVGRPVLAAQALLKQQKPKEALAKLHDADAVTDKSAYETYIVEETRAAAAVAAGDDAGALTALEAVLGTGVLPPDERLKRIQTQVQLAYRLKRYRETAALADRYDEQGGRDPLPRRLAAQAYFLEGDFAAAAQALLAALQAAPVGTEPPEDLLQTLASAEFQRHDAAGYRDALVRLVATYPKPRYWGDLLDAIRRDPGFPQRLALDLERLRLAKGAMETAEQYVTAAELALSEGFPGDAKRFLDRGYAAGILGKGEQAARQQRLADMAARQAAADAQALSKDATVADAAPNGVVWAKLGEAYASHGRYDAAIAALEKALSKGGLPRPGDARLELGEAYLGAGATAQARAALSAVSGEAAPLASLWLLSAARNDDLIR